MPPPYNVTDRDEQRRAMRSRFRPLFSAIEEQISFVGRTLAGAKLKLHESSKYQLALLLHLCRGSATCEGLMALCELGLGEQAMMLARVVAEGMVSAYWMSWEPGPRAD